MASHRFGPQFEKKRFRFEYSGDNDAVYRDNWERIFGGKQEPQEAPQAPPEAPSFIPAPQEGTSP